MGTQASPIGLRVCQCPAVYTLADVAEKLLLAETTRLMCHPTSREVKGMALSIATLKTMIREYHGFDLSDEELERIRPELESYLAEAERLHELNLADVMSARLLHADEGGQS
jgi:hypothetical protein